MFSPDPASVAPGRAPIVLVVQANPAGQAATRRLVCALGYQARGARDGRQALRAIHQHRGQIRAVITDLELRDMDGGELAERVKDLQPGIAVVLVTEYVPLGHAAELLAAYPELPVLKRPFGFRDLYTVLVPLLGPPRPLMLHPRGRRPGRVRRAPRPLA